MKNTIKKHTVAVGVGFALGFLCAVVLMGRPEPGAAASLMGYLILILLMLGTLGAGLAMVPGWWKEYRQRAQLGEAERMGRIYEALGGERARRAGGRRPAPANDGGPTIYVVGGGERSESQVREDLAQWLGMGQ